KMGKRFPEFVVNPSDIVRDYGADTLRLYEMFMGPLEASKPWSAQGVEGAKKFLDRIYRIFEDGKVTDEKCEELEKVYNQTVKKVTNDFETLNFNTAISQMMIFINEVYKQDKLPKDMAEGFVKLLNPIAPHITEELWEMLGHDNTIAYEAWPTYDESKMVDNEIEIPVQVNGKLKCKVVVAVDADKDTVLSLAKETLTKEVGEVNIVKEIYVPGKIVNIVAK
ncbi:MAG: class I tRNA ligase family protein, partial [Clostridia bacterium]|nr:class I tRNA ligase family protein [Clostridia bacterium]